MIYCKLKENNGKSAIYLVGKTVSNISGEAEFYSTFKQPTILKQPKTEEISGNLLSKIVIKYKEKLLSGNFPEKMSFEI